MNVVASGLTLGLQILVCSSNPRALRAFVEKLPSELRILCGDYACCEEGSIVDFHHALMKMQMHLAEEKEREDETEELISVSFLRLPSQCYLHVRRLSPAYPAFLNRISRWRSNAKRKNVMKYIVCSWRIPNGGGN